MAIMVEYMNKADDNTASQSMRDYFVQVGASELFVLTLISYGRHHNPEYHVIPKAVEQNANANAAAAATQGTGSNLNTTGGQSVSGQPMNNVSGLQAGGQSIQNSVPQATSTSTANNGAGSTYNSSNVPYLPGPSLPPAARTSTQASYSPSFPQTQQPAGYYGA